MSWLNVEPDDSVAIITSVSPGFTPLGWAGGLESAVNCAVVVKPMLLPPGKLPGLATTLKSTPAEFEIVSGGARKPPEAK